MMFTLKTASIALRKAAAIEGIRSGHWSPITDRHDGPSRKVAIVTNGRRTIELVQSDLDYADAKPWSEIGRQ